MSASFDALGAQLSMGSSNYHVGLDVSLKEAWICVIGDGEAVFGMLRPWSAT
jgi:hypothetical protein